MSEDWSDVSGKDGMPTWDQLELLAKEHGDGFWMLDLERFRRNLDLLSDRARAVLTVENDDKTFAPADLLSVCRSEGVPLVYDVHHHRCCPDGLTVEEASAAARATWNREPLFHISSPLEGWQGPLRCRHHDYINPADFPAAWLGWALTVEVEAKAKELAVARLQRDLRM